MFGIIPRASSAAIKNTCLITLHWCYEVYDPSAAPSPGAPASGASSLHNPFPVWDTCIKAGNAGDAHTSAAKCMKQIPSVEGETWGQVKIF